MAEYILIPDVERLRRKLFNSSGNLRILWEHFQDVALMNDPEHGAYPVFAYLVTGDVRYRKKAKAYILEKVLSDTADWDSTAFLNEHMWIHTALSAKYCIYYDWLINAGMLSDRESRAISDKIVSLSYNYVYRWARCVIDKPNSFPLPNNQMASVACGFLYAGYVFGQKHGCDLRAKSLFNLSRDIYGGLIGQVHKSGYNGEGAPYAFDITCSSLILYTSLIEEITGKALFLKKFPPNNVSLKDIIDAGLRLLSVSGLLIPIDSYGYSNGFGSLTPAVYAANKTKDFSYLALLYKYNLWNSDTMTWQKDDRIFSLIFWPEELEYSCSGKKKSWFLPDAFGGLVDEENGIELFQTYHNIQSGHDHVDPNSIVLEAYNSPLMLDGYPDPGKPYVFGSKSASLIDGRPMHFSGVESICSHNTITIDRNDFYKPRRDSNGRMTFFAETPLIDCLASDSAEIFKPDFDLKKNERRSIFVKPGYFLIYDRIEAADNHSYTYRIYLREKAEKTRKGIVVDTYEKVRMHMLMSGKEKLFLQHLDNYAFTTVEGKSACVACRKTGKKAEFLTLIRIEPLREEVFDITGNWRFHPDKENSGFKYGWHKRTFNDKNWQVLSVDRPWFFYRHGNIGEKGWYRRNIKIPDIYTCREIYMMLPKNCQTFAGWGGKENPLQLWINGKKIPLEQNTGCHHRFLNITKYLDMEKDNTVAMCVQSSTHAALSGKCILYAGKKPEVSPEISKVNSHVASVKTEGANYLVIFNNPEGKNVKLGSWHTDACVGFLRKPLSCGFLSMSRVGDKNGEFFCKSLYPVNFCRDGRSIVFSDCKYGNKVIYRDTELSFEMEYGNYICLETEYLFNSSSISLNADSKMAVYVNGSSVSAEYSESEKMISFNVRKQDKKINLAEISAALKGKDDTARIDAIIVAGNEFIYEVEEELINLLSSESFYVRAAAAETLGKLKSVKAVEPLLKCLTDCNWQVQKEAVISLGKIRDRRAVKPMIQLLKKDRYYLPLAIIWALSHFDGTDIEKVLKKQAEIYGSPIDRRAANRAISEIALKRRKQSK